jgi:hypothetical protein
VLILYFSCPYTLAKKKLIRRVFRNFIVVGIFPRTNTCRLSVLHITDKLKHFIFKVRSHLVSFGLEKTCLYKLFSMDCTSLYQFSWFDLIREKHGNCVETNPNLQIYYCINTACFRSGSHTGNHMKIKNPLDSCCPPSEELAPYYLLHHFACLFLDLNHSTWLDECTEFFLLHHCTVGKIPNFGSFILILW